MTAPVLFTTNQLGLASITLNRSELHNAFDEVLIAQLLDILKRIAQDPQIKVVLLSANGKSFSAGADLNWMRKMATYSYEQNLKDAEQLATLMHTLKFLNKPVIARVQGPAYGGGVGLVACCDMAFASTAASFCLSEVKIGLIPAVISPYVISAIGERAARRYFLTAEMMTATQALQLGLINEVCEPDALDGVVQNIITKLLQNGPQALSAAKALLDRVTKDPDPKKHQADNAAAIAKIRVSAEGQEGLAAFLEKRKPNWI